MLRKPHLYQQAISLRRKGYSYHEILRFVPVGYGTISRWCSHIILTREQKERLIRKQRNNKLIRTLVKNAVLNKQEAKKWAKNAISQLKLANIDLKLIILGISLYWAEGTKFNEDGHKSVEFTNTDSRMIKLMLKFFTEILLIPLNKIKVIIRIDKRGDINNAIKYWSRITSISRKNFRKPELLTLNQNSKSLNKYPRGICRLTINEVSVARKIYYLINYLYKDFRCDKLKKL